MGGVVSSLGVAGREGLCPFNFIIVNSVFSLLSIDVRTKIIHSKKKSLKTTRCLIKTHKRQEGSPG